MISKITCTPYDQLKKNERLAFIKERYKKLVLEPRQEIEYEMERALDDEDCEVEHL
ncbi:MAG: hypothetical protein MRJ65_07440 [Candidatus Brocadiaceae bacterium]|nr:hypothetical protein [Candidatus Brocadiaceae bacterium]